MTFDRYNELQLLEALERKPETTQADLAQQLGVAVGTVNWYLKRWSTKGLIKVKRIDRWRWRYLLTPQGVKEKANLARKYVDASLRVYRETRQNSLALLDEIAASGMQTVAIDGTDELAEIVSLSCLERGFVIADTPAPDVPVIVVRPFSMTLHFPTDVSEKEDVID